MSTMLYLLALQELCPVPFRCVDEINQGKGDSSALTSGGVSRVSSSFPVKLQYPQRAWGLWDYKCK